MKILLINHEFPPVGGGAAIASEALAKFLSALGHDVEVITSRIGGLKSRDCRGAYQIKRVLGCRRSVFSGKLLEVTCFLMHGFLYFFSRGKENKSDVVYAFFTLPAGLLALFLKKAYKIPYFVFLRGIDVPGFYGGRGSFLNKLLKPLIKYIWNNANKVIANSSALKDLAGRDFKYKEIAVLPNMIDIDFFNPSGKPHEPGPVKIIFVGRLNKQKGLNYLLDSLAIISRGGSEAEFVMELAGDGPEKNDLMEKSCALGISGKTVFLGWLDRERLLVRYQGADIFITVSLDEGMPNAVMEAMACGLPVIASDIPAHRELIEDGVNGMLVSAREPEAVAKVLKVLMRDKALRKRLGDNGARKIKQYSSTNFWAFLQILDIS